VVIEAAEENTELRLSKATRKITKNDFAVAASMRGQILEAQARHYNWVLSLAKELREAWQSDSDLDEGSRRHHCDSHFACGVRAEELHQRLVSFTDHH